METTTLKEFNKNQKTYLDIAEKEELAIKGDKNIFILSTEIEIDRISKNPELIALLKKREKQETVRIDTDSVWDSI